MKCRCVVKDGCTSLVLRNLKTYLVVCCRSYASFVRAVCCRSYVSFVRAVCCRGYASFVRAVCCRSYVSFVRVVCCMGYVRFARVIRIMCYKQARLLQRRVMKLTTIVIVGMYRITGCLRANCS